MSDSQPQTLVTLLGGRLAVDFVNAPSYPSAPFQDLSWEDLISFLEAARIVSAERGASLLALSATDTKAAAALLARATSLRRTLRQSFTALVRGEPVRPESATPINQILRITEGHDELVQRDGAWRLEFIPREGGSDWLLAAIARSAAEILTEPDGARLRTCANPACGLLFCDNSRTHRRRWCSMSVCGNRSKVASFSRRHAS
jgi:predicted RNA-binding Zn ribbon-like protein